MQRGGQAAGMSSTASGPRIWLDGFPLSHPLGTGITTYSRGFARTLTAAGAQTGVLFGRPLPDTIAPQDRDVRFFDAAGPIGRPLRWRLSRLVTQPGGPLAMQVASAAVERQAFPAATMRQFTTASVPPRAELWNANDMFGRGHVHMHLFRRMLGVQCATPPAVMHWMQVHPLHMRGTRNVYTIHDLIPMRVPWATHDSKRLWVANVRAIAAMADHILTVSEHARQDIISLLGVPEDRVTNTYQAVFPPQPLAEGGEALERLRGVLDLEPDGYFLFLSTVEPRKNIPRLIDAYYASGSRRPLVIVGQKGLHYEEQLRLLTKGGGTLSADGRVRFLDYLPRLDVDTLLRHARALLFPSLYEGFGLPPVEAMQVGTPVLTSSTTALPEVVGDAALTVEPTDTQAIAEGIRALDTDDALCGRLGAAGPAQAALFSPERYQRRLEEVHRRLGVPLDGRA